MESISIPFSQTRSQRLPSLDGWRAIAFLLVLGSHFPYSIGFPEGAIKLIGSVFDGNLGVRIFFTLSGFIITWLLLKEESTLGRLSLSRFYARRSLRILPVYWGYLLALGLLSALGRYHDTRSSWVGSLTFTRNVVGRGDSATVHLWSLAIEEQFYLCWPLVFKLGHLTQHKTRALWLLALVVVAVNIFRLYASTFPDNLQTDHFLGAHSILRYADCLAIGCMGAFVRSGGGWKPVRFSGAFAWLLILSNQGLDRLAPVAWSKVGWLLPTLQGFGFVWLMLDSIDRPQLYSFLNWRALVFIGSLSYSLYIWQMVFLDHFAPGAMPEGLDLWYVWVFSAGGVAWLSYIFLERPLATLRSKLA